MSGRKSRKLPSWVIPSVISTVALTTVGLLVAFPPDWEWLGVGKNQEVSQVTTEKIDLQSRQKTVSTTKYEQAKNLWDWLSLLGVPLSLALLAWWLQQLQQKRAEEQATLQQKRSEEQATSEKEIAEENQCEEVLQAYFDRISTLLIDRNVLAISTRVKKQVELCDELYNLSEQKELLDAAADVVRARTLSILRRLKNDPVRKASVLLFLIETEVIRKLDVDLNGAHLEGAHLNGVHLENAKLFNAKLFNAHLENAHLEGAQLSYARLENADLINTKLIGADLIGANLINAKLIGADLEKADLENAHLNGAYLKDTKLNGAYLEGAYLIDAKDMLPEQIKRAKNWEKAYYDPEFREKLGLPPEE